MSHLYRDEVLRREDIALVESVQRGMRSGAFERGRYLIDRVRTGLSEHAVHHFHSLVLDAYARAVPTQLETQTCDRMRPGGVVAGSQTP